MNRPRRSPAVANAVSPPAGDVTRRNFLVRAAALAAGATLLPELLRAQDKPEEAPRVAADVIAKAEQLTGITFSDAEREMMGTTVAEHIESMKALADLKLGNEVAPATIFRPLAPLPGGLAAAERAAALSSVPVARRLKPPAWLAAADKTAVPSSAPGDLEQLAFAPLPVLAALLKRRVVTSTQLTKMYLARLRRLDEQLQCIITLTEERALEQAARADEELRRGKARGPLHGVPWGLKDLFSVRGANTTWGSVPFKDQRIEQDATVVQRLDAAGAVLIAKTAVGELAWGDVWFGGTTKNPWKLDQGSSGSSAGSASAVAAGGLPFGIGTETLGSIVSPCSRCGATGIRPTFGRVPRTGGMALSWTMDKVGAIARSAQDAALVLDAIHGADGVDADAVSVPLRWIEPKRVTRLRVGVAQADFDKPREERETERAIDLAALEVLRRQGIELQPVELPDMPYDAILTVLEVEAAAAFDELTRSNRDDLMVRQVEQAWPNIFRAAQLVPAVQYVQAQRARTLLARRFAAALEGLDAYVSPAFMGPTLLATNLTGHPAVVLPNGFREDGTPTSMTVIGKLYGEAEAAAVAWAYQQATDWHRRHPTV